MDRPHSSSNLTYELPLGILENGYDFNCIDLEACINGEDKKHGNFTFFIMNEEILGDISIFDSMYYVLKSCKLLFGLYCKVIEILIKTYELIIDNNTISKS